ncbi:right-handed parallel beta-helix repeat-containing protein, partial [uncultured Methanobrevibacter sp.]|uniref:right-handed parallel beta-helix repeat-containing protein n=1 Tax=uncultured Methanobrevibacter sp. TaxID=253161 RepID=UPI0025FF2899
MILFLFVSLLGAASAVEDSTLNNTITTTSGGGVLSVPIVESADVLSAQTYEISGSSFDDIQNFFDTTQLESGDIVYLGNTNYRSTWQAHETKYITLNTNGIIISGGSLANPNGISTLDGNMGRIFKLNASGITLTNIEFTNTGDSNGGAITGESLATNTIIENCNFTNNKGAWGNPGTAIYLRGSNSEFNNCNFKENYVSGSLIHTTGTTNFNNCIFDNNNDPGWSVTYLINNEGITNINNCNFTNNHPGAIYSTGTTNVVNSNFTDNNGGAVYSGADTEIKDCNFKGTIGSSVTVISQGSTNVKNSNFTDNAGAGIYSVGNVEITDSVLKDYNGAQYNNKNIGAVYSGGTTTVENSIFERNTATNDGYGGIYSEGTTNVVNSNFTENTGGAIYSGANAEVSGCIIADNSGTHSAVDVYGTAIIDNCNFTGNTLTNNGHAGALSVTGDNSKITNCNFDNNKAGYGAAIYNTGENLLIDNCNFTNNMLTVNYGYGGAIQSTGASTSVKNSKFKKNDGGASGGAIEAGSSGFTALNCEFEENTANDGGALYINHDDAIITNCNFTSNSAANQGGAIYIAQDCYNADMSYCNFKDNSATSGTAIYAADGANGKVSDCNFEGVTDLSVDGEYPYLNFTLTMDASNMVVGDIEGKPSGSVVPLVGVEIKLEIRNSTGDWVETYTQNTDDNGQISYDYSHLPVGTYKYNATYLDGKSKEGTFGTVEVEGDKFSDIQNAIDSLDSGGVIILKNITYHNDIDSNMVIGNTIKIIGNSAVLDAEGESRVFNINSNNVYVENVTFINGNAENGGAIYIGNDCHNEDINNCTFKGNSATSGIAIYCEGTSDGKVSDCNFEGVSDLSVNGGYPELTLTLATDLSNAVVGNVEGKPSGTIPLVDEEIKLDIYDSNGAYVETFTNTTDSNGQIVYNYAHLPLDTYKYNATYLDGKSKEGSFGVVVVQGDKFSDIQDAIDHADPGTVLVLKDITYTNDIDGKMDIDKSITIIGNGAVLDAEGKSRIFDIHANNVNLDNITFINGVANDGGAVYIADGSNNIGISNSTFSNNAASNDGGAIFIQHSTYALNFNNVTFTENTAGRGGGGVKSYSTGSGVNFDNCSFIKNNATGDAGTTDSEFGGGGLWCYNTVTHITNCTFDSNRG